MTPATRTADLLLCLLCEAGLWSGPEQGRAGAAHRYYRIALGKLPSQRRASRDVRIRLVHKGL